MGYVLCVILGYFLYPIVDISKKILKNAWTEYKKQS
jgi:hypothetical protein